MFIILHGEDSYEREIKRQEILKVFKEKNKILSFEVANFSEDSGFNKAYNFCSNEGLFSGPRLLYIKNTFDYDNRKVKKLFEFMAKQKNLNILLSEYKIPKIVSSFMRSPNMVQVFPLLDSLKLKQRVIKIANNLNVDYREDGLTHLISIFNEDSWSIVNAIKMLSLLKLPLDIKSLSIIQLEIKKDSFALLRNFESELLSIRLSAYIEAENNKEDFAKIFNILAFRNTTRVSEFCKYDLSIKSGKIDYNTAILDYILY